MYKLAKNNSIVRIHDNAVIPLDENNLDYQQFIQWMNDGNEPEPYVPPEPTVPAAVTMRQARLALLNAGLLDSVETAIENLLSPEKEAARIEWEYSQEVQRHNGFVSVLANSIGLTEQQVDDLFLAAIQL